VMLTYAHARVGEINRLRELGVRHFVLRALDGEFNTLEQRRRLAARVADLMPLGVGMVVAGCEPENIFSMKWGATSWGHWEAWNHRERLFWLLDELRPLRQRGLRVVSAGWTYRGHYRDWREGVQPGEQQWLEITRVAYNECDLNGFHWYGADGTPYDIHERMRVGLWQEQGRRHRALFIDELGVDRGTPVERMGAYIRIAELLERTNLDEPWGGSGERVEGLVPFVSNGVPNGHWDEGKLLREPRCYELLGRFMRGE
jgi:hypothetical protein